MTELIKEYYNTNELKLECYAINNVKEGEFKYYYDTGELFLLFTYVNDKIHGHYTSYYKSSVTEKLIFLNNKK